MTENLAKVYGRKGVPAIEDLDLHIAEGELFGFLGPNGAGKTTTIRVLTTLLRPTRGRAWVAGHDVVEEPLEAMSRVGFMPENPGFYGALTGRQHLRYYASLYGMDRSQVNGRIDGLLRRVGLQDAEDRKAKAYSLGMKRRLALAGAILPDPDILILDEPSLGLDPGGMAFVRSLLQEVNSGGTTVFLSSHILSEVEKICTRVGVLHKGRMLRVEAPRELVRTIGSAGAGLQVEVKGVTPEAIEGLKDIEGVTEVESEGRSLRVLGSLDDDTVAEVNRRLVTAGVAILSSRRLEADLEQAFMALTEDRP